GDTAQVGPGIAEHLNLPHTTYVKEIVDINKETITAKRKIENGHEVIEMQLSALLTVIKEINEPRLPSIRGILRSREIEVPVWTVDDLDVDENAIGLDGSPTQVVSVTTPDLDVEAEMFDGDCGYQVDCLIKALSEQKIL
ncbi:MAG: electron transfer flavoprotein subunit beta/FixA family protein, partial [Halothermotrichaceae bacterium]